MTITIPIWIVAAIVTEQGTRRIALSPFTVESEAKMAALAVKVTTGIVAEIHPARIVLSTDNLPSLAGLPVESQAQGSPEVL